MEIIRKHSEFPLLEEYKKFFAIDKYTIFALYPFIYTDYDLTPDLLIHELVHHRQQEKHGVKEWVYDFLYNPKFRLKQEVEAYTEQLKSIKDREQRAKVRWQSAKQLSSSLYGNIISFQDALKALK